MIDEFNSVISDTNEAINNVDFHLNNSINYLKEFIIEREKIIKLIGERKEELKRHMSQRFTANTLGHTAILSGKALAISGIWFPLVLVPGFVISAGGWMSVAISDLAAIQCLANDKEKSQVLENSQIKLKEVVGKFKEIYSRFEDSEYREQNIDSKKIGAIKNVMKKILGEEIDANMSLEADEKTEHSTGLKALRAAVEAFCKLVPSPLSFYCVYRDHKEVEGRTSLEDMEKAIKNWEENLTVLKEKEQLLNIEYEKISWCKE
ncbi:4531_t:CDS:2, partial [Racocetra persica]